MISTSARNTTPLVTTYSYTSGFQTFTTYRDITPDVTTTYDAFGRVSTIILPTNLKCDAAG